MKNVFCVSLSLLALSVKPLCAQVIYGLDSAKQYTGTPRQSVFVQIGSFKEKHNAERLKAELAYLSYPIRIHQTHGYYAVQVGPLTSSAMVRRVGDARVQIKKPVYRSNKANPVPVYHPPQPVYTKPPRPIAVSMDKDAALSPPIVAGHWFIGVDGGGLWSDTSNRILVPNGSQFPAPANVDRFSTNVDDPGMVDGLIGYRWQFQRQWLPNYELALRYQHLFSQTISGSILQYSLPAFNNYTYQWRTSSDVLSLYTKIDLIQYKRLMPYVDAGIGSAWNKGGRYQETAKSGVTPRVSPAFGSSRNAHLTYNVGAGLDFIINPKLIASVGYDYQSFGRITSGAGQSTWSATRLNLGHFTANTILAGVTVLIY